MLKVLQRSLVALAALAAPLVADGSTLAIDSQPNDMGGVDVTLDLTGGIPMSATFLAVGETPGETVFELGSLGTLTLGLDLPFALVPFGTTDMDGNLSFSISTSTTLGAELHVQAVNVGLSVDPPPPTLDVCASNVATASL